MRSRTVFGAWFGVAAATAVCLGAEREASACGGCFTPPPPPNEVESVITDERMVFSISKDQTTLYDQIHYSGSPSSFAWVLPIKGKVTVGLSADLLFTLIDQLTASQVVEPPTDCPAPPICSGSGGGLALAGGDDGGAGGGPVVVSAQQQVGPYETVQLHSTDGSALTNWLDSHGYAIAKPVVPVIAAYVADGFDFLALKLVPGAGVQSMQPVRVTSQGAAVSLPLRMVAIGTGPTTGISIWVLGDGRWEPQNFPFFTIKDSEISWDWATSSSNYETLRLSKEGALKGRGWQFESSLDINQDTIRQELTQSIEYGSSSVGGYLSAEGSGAADAGAVDGAVDGGSADAGFADGAVADGSAADGALVDGGPGTSDAAVPGDADFGDAVATSDGEDEFDSGDTSPEIEAATKDLDVLFAGIVGPNVRITRMRSDVAHSALTSDMVLQASSDQSEVSNLHYPQQQIGQPQCPVYDPSTCLQTGTAPRDQAVAAESASGGGADCNATRKTGDPRTSIAVVLGLVGLGVIRSRRRRGGR